MSIKEVLKSNKCLVRGVHNWRRFRSNYSGINWYKTFYVNIKTQGFRRGMKLPIFIYGKLKIYDLSGQIVITAPIKKGMIRLGFNTDRFSASKGSAMMQIGGKLIFEGYTTLSVDYVLDIQGTCTIGELTGMGNSVRIRCWDQITIGKGCRIGLENQIFDTNFHYTRNIETGKVYRSRKKVSIGNFCWLGNRTTTMKGTCLPEYSIVAGNSLLNKDYTKENIQCPTLGGIPAKIIGAGNVRVFSANAEAEINEYFLRHPEAPYFEGETGMVDETQILRDFYAHL